MLSHPGGKVLGLGVNWQEAADPAAGLTKQRNVGAHSCTPAWQHGDPVSGFHILCLWYRCQDISPFIKGEAFS